MTNALANLPKSPVVALFIKDIEITDRSFVRKGYAEQRLYKLSKLVSYKKGWGEDAEVCTSEYIVASAVQNSFAFETYLFPGDAEGYIVDFGELPGSQKGSIDIEQVLTEAGYLVMEVL